MKKRSRKGALEFEKVVSLVIVVLILLAIVLAISPAFRNLFAKITGVGQQVTNVEVPSLEFLSPSQLKQLTPQEIVMRTFEEADAAFAKGTSTGYEEAKKLYQDFLDKCADPKYKDYCSDGHKARAAKNIDEANNKILEISQKKATAAKETAAAEIKSAEEKAQKDAFYSMVSIKDERQKLAAYEKFINDYPKSTYVGDANLELAKLYDFAIAFEPDFVKAKQYYILAKNTKSSLSTEVNKLLVGLPSTNADAQDIQQKRLEFYATWQVEFLRAWEGRDKEGMYSSLKKLDDALAQGLRVNPDDVANIRIDEIRAYKIYADSLMARKAYDNLKAETDNEMLLKQAQDLLGPESSGQAELTLNSIKPLYGKTGLMLISHDGTDSEICVTYDNKKLDFACETFTNAVDYKAFDFYPFVELKVSVVGHDTTPTKVSYNLIGTYGLENTIELRDDQTWHDVDVNNRKKIFDEIPLWVQYDTNELLFSNAVAQYTDMCGANDGSPTDIDWGYKNAGPIADAIHVCPNMPSVSIYHQGWQKKNNVEYVKVKFVYTP